MNVRSVKRVVRERRWLMRNLEEVKWAPWHRYKDDENADGDVPEGVEREEREQRKAEGDPREEEVAESRERVKYLNTSRRPPRELYITKAVIEKYGTTQGCSGCNYYKRGFGTKVHI